MESFACFLAVMEGGSDAGGVGEGDGFCERGEGEDDGERAKDGGRARHEGDVMGSITIAGLDC